MSEAVEALLRREKVLTQRMERQEAKSLGPTLGEFYGQFIGLPGLRGLWLPGTFNDGGSIYSLSNGNADPLIYNGNPTHNLYNNLIPYIDLDGTGDEMVAADSGRLEISGTESYVAAALRGMTIGGWFWSDAKTADDRLIGKDNVGTSRAYNLFVRETGDFCRFGISSDGSAVTEVQSSNTFDNGVWNFALGRYIPSTELSVYLNGTWSDNTTSIPASIYTAGTAPLALGGRGDGTNNLLDGRCALAFLSVMTFPDELVNYLWQRGRIFFGV